MGPTLRKLGSAALGLALIGVLGCNEDNEKAARITSTAPPPGSLPPPKSPAEYAERSGGQMPKAYSGGTGYPGAPKR